MHNLLENILPQKIVIEDSLVEHDFEIIGHLVMLFNTRKLVIESHSEELILLGIHDITYNSNNDEIEI